MEERNPIFTQNKKLYLAALGVVCLMVFAAYCNTFYAPPALDDFHSFIDEPAVRINSWSIEDLRRLSTTMFGWSRWLPMISFSLDIWVGEGSLFQLHLTNLLIHISTFLAVLFLVFALSRHAKECPSTSESLPDPSTLALWVAGLWALNPVHTSAVTYLVQRMAAMMALFFVLSVAFYAAGRLLMLRRGGFSAKAGLCFLLSFLTMIMSFFSKQNSVMLPFTLVCVETWFFRPQLPGEVWNFLKRRRILSLIALGLILIVLYYKIPPLLVGYSHRHFTLTQRLLTELRVVVWYISVILWPNPGRLSLEHDIPLSTSLIHPPSTLACLLVLVSMILWAVRKRQRFPLASFGIVWFFLNLAVESSFLPLELVFEHRVYLPSVGLMLSLVVLVYTGVRKAVPEAPRETFLKLGWCLAAILASALTLATFSRNTVWENSVDLARHDAQVNPNCPRAHVNLAVALNRAHRFEEALESAYKALEVTRPNYEAYSVAANALVIAHSQLGNYETGIREAERILRETPPKADAGAAPLALINIGRAHRKMGNLEQSYQAARRALTTHQRLTPQKIPEFELLVMSLLSDVYVDAREGNIPVDFDEDGEPDSLEMPRIVWMAEQFHKWNDRETARTLLTQAAADHPDDLRSAELLSQYRREDEMNRIQEEKKDFTSKYLRWPSDRFRACMAIAFLTEKKKLPSFFAGIGEAALDYALRLRPDSADAHLLKAWFCYNQDKSEEAIGRAQKALALDRDYARAWLGLGFFLAKAGRTEEALDAFQKCLDLYPGNPDRVAITTIAAELKSKFEGRQAVNDPKRESSARRPSPEGFHPG